MRPIWTMNLARSSEDYPSHDYGCSKLVACDHYHEVPVHFWPDIAPIDVLRLISSHLVKLEVTLRLIGSDRFDPPSLIVDVATGEVFICKTRADALNFRAPRNRGVYLLFELNATEKNRRTPYIFHYTFSYPPEYNHNEDFDEGEQRDRGLRGLWGEWGDFEGHFVPWHCLSKYYSTIIKKYGARSYEQNLEDWRRIRTLRRRYRYQQLEAQNAQGVPTDRQCAS